MGNRLWQFGLLFVGAVASQALLFDNMVLWNYVSPLPYVIFILLLPSDTPRLWQLVLAFVLGLSIDALASSLGLHAAASTLMAFLRPYLLGRLHSRQGKETDYIPSMGSMGSIWSLKYTLILVAAHHVTLFFLATTSMSNLWNTFARALVTTIFTSFMVLLLQLFLFSTTSKSN